MMSGEDDQEVRHRGPGANSGSSGGGRVDMGSAVFWGRCRNMAEVERADTARICDGACACGLGTYRPRQIQYQTRQFILLYFPAAEAVACSGAAAGR